MRRPGPGGLPASLLARGKLEGVPEDLGAALDELQRFLQPVLDRLAQGGAFDADWTAGGPWSPQGPGTASSEPATWGRP